MLRDANITDSLQLVGLLAQLGSQFNTEKDIMEKRITAFSVKNHRLIVVEIDNLIVGLIAFGCYQQFRLVGSCCHIDALIVDTKHRGKGIGKKLIAFTEEWANKNGATSIELVTANHRRESGTHNFYLDLGYSDNEKLDYTYFMKDLSL